MIRKIVVQRSGKSNKKRTEPSFLVVSRNIRKVCTFARRFCPDSVSEFFFPSSLFFKSASCVSLVCNFRSGISTETIRGHYSSIPRFICSNISTSKYSRYRVLKFRRCLIFQIQLNPNKWYSVRANKSQINNT